MKATPAKRKGDTAGEELFFHAGAVLAMQQGYSKATAIQRRYAERAGDGR